MIKKGIVASALILTAAGLITRLLGFIYRIYMSNLIGAEGMGLYQLIIPIYTLAWSISCSGLTTTISKITAQEKAKKEYGNINKFLKISFIISIAISTCVTFFLFVFSEQIAINIFKDKRIILSLKILSSCFPFMALGSCIRGYFLGLHEASVPAKSQVYEQIIRMFIIYSLSPLFAKIGIEYACTAAIIGIVIGEIFSFLYVLIKFHFFKKKHNFIKRNNISTYKAFYLIISMSLPLTLNRVFSSLLSTLENILIPQKLQTFGLSYELAISEFGKLIGMAMPLIQFPSTILMSISISLVPTISESLAIKNYKNIHYTITKSMIFTTILGIGTSGVFILFSDNIGYIIYKQNMSDILLYLGLISPLLYMQMTLSGILNGLGEQIFIFRNNLFASCISISFILFIVPKLGINGFILGWFISLSILCLLNLNRIKKIVNIKIKLINWLIKPIFCISASCVITSLIKNYLFNIFGHIFGTIICLSILGIIYLSFIFLTGCLTKDDLKILSKN